MDVLTAIDRERIAELQQRDEFFWLDLRSPTPDDIRALGEVFGFHEMALRDSEQFGQRPKLDIYDGFVLLVFYGARLGADGQPELLETHMYLSGSYVVTVRHAPCEELDELHDKLREASGGTEQFIVYRILDRLTDTFFPVLADMDDQIDELEDAVVTEPTDEQLHQIFGLKRSLVTLRKIVTPQRDLFARAIDDIADIPGLEAGQRDYFRDVYDHLIRISDLIDSYRDLLTGAMDVYLSTVSNRLNAIMKQLTIIATVFLPLTVVTGFFGQNFGWLVDHVRSFDAFLIFGVGGMVVPIVGLFAWFRRAGYL